MESPAPPKALLPEFKSATSVQLEPFHVSAVAIDEVVEGPGPVSPPKTIVLV